MDEVINKSDGQFKNILDELVDYNKHASKKDPLIKELSRAKSLTCGAVTSNGVDDHSSTSKKSPSSSTKAPQAAAATQLAAANKPGASLNSSTYSSAASSSDSSSSSSSVVSDSSSTSSSIASSPSQSTNTATTTASKENHLAGEKVDLGCTLEIAKLENLGKTARILEHRLATAPSTSTIKNAGAANGPQTKSLSDNTSAPTAATLLNTNSPIDTFRLSAANFVPYGDSFAIKGQQLNSLSPNSTTTTTIFPPTQTTTWKTINAKRDKKRRKPIEKPILAKHIPGHRGDLTVEELTKFIESGNNGSSNIHNSNKNSKKQHNSNSLTNNNNSNNNPTLGNNNSQIVSSSSSASTGKMQNTIKPFQNSSKITNSNTPKNLPSTSQQTASPTTTNTTTNAVTNNPPTNSRIQQLKQHQSAPDANKSANPKSSNLAHQSKSVSNSSPAKLSNHQNKQAPQNNNINQQQQNPMKQHHRDQSQQQIQSQKQPSPQLQRNPTEQGKHFKLAQVLQPNQEQLKQDQDQEAVIFAHHIRVLDEHTNQYSFGFFDDQCNQTQQDKPINNRVKNVSQLCNSKILANQNEQKNKQKQSKSSPNSEEKIDKYNDNIDAITFNYEQILKFISSAWNNTQAQLAQR